MGIYGIFFTALHGVIFNQFEEFDEETGSEVNGSIKFKTSLNRFSNT
jgi:hypothetical protein